MEKRRHIILNIILLLFVFFFSGISVHSNSEKQRYYLEHVSGSNNVENELSHHIDSSEEDQMDQSQIMLLPEKSECQKFIITSLALPNNLFVSVWQPPKVY